MPNSFTVFPNVLPGNVTIGGNLTVSGDQLRIGAASPFMRVGKDPTGRAVWSLNIATDFSARDDNTKDAQGIFYDPAVPAMFYNRMNTAGTDISNALMQAIFSDYVDHGHTGTTTLDTIYTKTIPANTLGANGAIRLRFCFTSSVQGAGTTNITVTFGPALTTTVAVAGVTSSRVAEITITNRNATNAQFLEQITLDGGGTITATQNTGATDTTADQVLAVKVQSANATDNQQFHYLVAHQLNSFGPV